MNADRINELYAGQVFDLPAQKTARERIHWICKQAQGEKILDIGCSQGIVCLLLGREGFNCIGVDCEQGAINFALKELEKEEHAVRERVKFQLADATKLPFEDNIFDTVILGENLEHLIHPEKVLQEARRVVKEGGKTIITTPFGLNPADDHKRTYYPSSLLETVRPYFRTQLIDTLNDNIIYCGNKDASYDLSKVSRETLLLEDLKMQEKVEERCLTKEQALFEKTKTLYAQIKTLNDKINSLTDTNRRLESALKEEDKELKFLKDEEKQLQEALSITEKQLKEILALKVALETTEKTLKNSVTWRIGRIFVGSYKSVRDFCKKPLEAIRDMFRYFKKFQTLVTTGESIQKAMTGQDFKKYIVKKKGPSGSLTYPGVKCGVIVDEFTMSCLSPECELITFRPDNWKETLEQDPPKVIFIESAWRGNDGSWQYRVAKYPKNMGDELRHLLAWAKEKNIPSIFWNKEDPSHFDRFVGSAALFDYIFTSDANCIPEYQKQLGHNRIFPLPFAAQPVIHNPILAQPREGSVCFAGAYYGDSFDERRSDMEYILKPALDYGLEIYDRQHGLTGTQAELFRFPDIYQSSIKGRLDYDEMVKAYKKYRVFLNVNSIKTSPTMFSRRVYELLACGTPVISTNSKGILELLGDDIVFISESEEDTKKHLEYLLNDSDAWLKASVRGIRKVMEEHTYAIRMHYVLDCVGIKLPETIIPSISIVVNISDVKEIDRLADMINSQVYRKIDLIILSDTALTGNNLDRLRNLLEGINITNVNLQSNDPYAQCVKDSHSDYFAIMDVRDYYGPNYLRDYALAIMYSKADFIGKHSFFKPSQDKTIIDCFFKGYEFQFVKSIPSATLVVKKNALKKENFIKYFRNRIFEVSDQKIFSIDPYNYLQNAFGNQLIEKLRVSVEV